MYLGLPCDIVSACPVSVQTLSYMAKEWNIPVITPAGYKGTLKNKTLFPTLTRLSPFGQEQFAEFTVQLLDSYGWNHIAIIYDNSEPTAMSSLMGDTFVDFFMDTDYDWTDFAMTSSEMNDKGYENILKEASENARIFIIHATIEDIRDMLLVAHQLGYTDGEYAFIVTISLRKAITEAVWKRGDGKDEIALEAFQGALFLSLLDSNKSEFQIFMDAVRKKAKKKHDISIRSDDQISDIVGYYNAFSIYASVLNETLTDGGDPYDGRELTRRMRNRTFQGIAGPITLNENNGRYSNLALHDIAENGEVVVVGVYMGKERIYERAENQEIIWPKNSSPPLDVPVCGFKGYRCEYKTANVKLIGGLTGGLVFLFVIGALVFAVYFSLWKRASKIERWWWMVDDKKLMTATNNDRLSAQSLSSRFSSITPKSDLLPDYKANLAIYKGLPVRLRMLTMKNINYDKQLLDEFEHDMIGNAEVKMDDELKFALWFVFHPRELVAPPRKADQ
ncbi:atrial natriuretic peptide receptor 3-like [Haliotis rufescens]|uniref:atrial natriuretic peptide receptor 3-like n=1 Tax=Haliotis rufescens TaxID=6454 RepID=UPI001EAFAA15|nr:atrial natriuretic peptide receptor 3-like [Haliotis rufescens]